MYLRREAKSAISKYVVVWMCLYMEKNRYLLVFSEPATITPLENAPP
jgi:hypothetical protein